MSTEAPSVPSALTTTSWPVALTCLVIGLSVLFAGYWQTFLSMAQIWQRSETFAHGFLIFPISLYLIWQHRRALAAVLPRPEWRGILVLAGLGFVWLLANVADVLVIQQLGFIALIVALVWTVLGWQVVRQIAFPLGFLFFAVPIGEFLIPPLMNFTADFTVKLIELTGIPIYREGTFFSIPSGDWSVVEGCSGLRYLIASITVGCLYAYLSYRSLWRRLAFITLATFFPIIANGLRAYGIVMIAHLSDMKLALGVDHYLYGWVFFGLVMLLMFWIGSFWQEKASPLKAGAGSEPASALPRMECYAGSDNARALVAPTLAALAVLLVWPAYAGHLRTLAHAEGAGLKPAPTLHLPDEAGNWRKIDAELTAWKPRYLFPDAEVAATYSDGRRRAKLYVLYYRTQAQGKELINSQNVLVPQKHPGWRMPWEKPYVAVLSSGYDPHPPQGGFLKVRQGLVESSKQTLLVWRWNFISDRFTTSDHLAKLLEAKDKLLGRPKDAAGIVVAVEYDRDQKLAEEALRDFVGAMLPKLNEVLIQAGEGRYR